jgi:hypothetical protein
MDQSPSRSRRVAAASVDTDPVRHDRRLRHRRLPTEIHPQGGEVEIQTAADLAGSLKKVTPLLAELLERDLTAGSNTSTCVAQLMNMKRFQPVHGLRS